MQSWEFIRANKKDRIQSAAASHKDIKIDGKLFYIEIVVMFCFQRLFRDIFLNALRIQWVFMNLVVFHNHYNHDDYPDVKNRSWKSGDSRCQILVAVTVVAAANNMKSLNLKTRD